MFQTPALIMLTIGATRMHRSLVNFASSDCRTFDARPTGKVSAIMFAAPIPHSQVEAAFHVSSESADYPPANIGSGAGCEPQDEHFVLDIVVKDLENGG
ncbi:hypothetical protein EI94DRAFT_1738980 [Lactarius quietus]|nr:hypothetical protein EI94DRAFT_1738980 [Lactarius quietus]